MPLDPGVKIIQEWVVDHAQYRTFLVYQPERDGNEWEAMDKVGRSWASVRRIVTANTVE